MNNTAFINFCLYNKIHLMKLKPIYFIKGVFIFIKTCLDIDYVEV